MFTSTKSYFNYSCAHRQWRDNSHCKFIHGYDRSFHFFFKATHLNETKFVMHFGQLKELKAFLDDTFDHTLLINRDDPLLPEFVKLHEQQACKLIVMENVGMEGTAEYVWQKVNELLKEKEGGRVCCYKVEVREHEKNSACYEAEPLWFNVKELDIDGYFKNK